MLALFITSTEFTETATAIAKLLPPPPPSETLAEPSDVALESVLAVELTLTAPPAVTVTPSAIDALAVDAAMLIAMAAATLTLTVAPSPFVVVACGVALPPEPLALLSLAVASPLSRCAWVWASTFGDVMPSFLAPLTLASASAVDTAC